MSVTHRLLLSGGLSGVLLTDDLYGSMFFTHTSFESLFPDKFERRQVPFSTFR